MGASAAFSLVTIAISYIIRWVLIRENRKIKQSNSEATLFYAY